MLKKILIANRGEIALRIIRTCRTLGIKTVAIYSTADKESLHVKFADEAVCVGPPPSKDSYLNIPRIIAAAEITGANAIHPGYGFLSENAQFASICSRNKIIFIGPTAAQIQKMGDKITAKDTMIKAGVPTVPGSGGLVSSLEDAKKISKKIGFPVIIKATAGGGGKGMRIVKNLQKLETAYLQAKQESLNAFKNDGLYIEKFIEEPRHIEIQVAGDKHGHYCHLSERDCSIQRRHQKLVEESPSPFMTPKLREEMGNAALAAIHHIQYEGVGTLEFLVDKHRNFYFMEMNTRIQVEHCVTEEVTGFDLIKEQILIAAGKKISGENYEPTGHAIECRINAEDPAKDFRPCPGKVTFLHQPGGHGLRIDSHIYSGYTIPPFYDSMIGKIISLGDTRKSAIEVMTRALSEYVIDGVATTIPFHLQLMQDKKFRSGNFNTAFLESFKLK